MCWKKGSDFLYTLEALLMNHNLTNPPDMLIFPPPQKRVLFHKKISWLYKKNWIQSSHLKYVIKLGMGKNTVKYWEKS